MNQKVQPYNFKRPDRISKKQLLSLHLVHERFARNTSSAISGFLRKAVEIRLERIEQMTYADFLQTVNDPTCYASMSLKPLEGSAALEIDPEAIFSILDRLLGGAGTPLETQRAMTEIEQRVVGRFLDMIVENLREAWRPIYPIEFAITGTETHPHMLRVVSQNDMVAVFKFEMEIRDQTATMSMAFPTLVLEPIIHIFDKEWPGRKKNAVGSTLAGTIEKVPVNVTIETGSTEYTMRSILSLQEGDTLVLEQRTDAPMMLRVGGKEKLKAVARLEADQKSFEIVGSVSERGDG